MHYRLDVTTIDGATCFVDGSDLERLAAIEGFARRWQEHPDGLFRLSGRNGIIEGRQRDIVRVQLTVDAS